jgi:hypothetical protein
LKNKYGIFSGCKYPQSNRSLAVDGDALSIEEKETSQVLRMLSPYCHKAFGGFLFRSNFCCSLYIRKYSAGDVFVVAM